ncbi:MAG: stage II sporulation protein P [Oscillospiraceae bacterium]|nr:stage II sporulation protein P [Oscillospiraceae bacterium]
MEQKQALRLGAGAVILAIFIRLLSAGFFQPLFLIFGHEKVLSFLIYLETGHTVRFYDSSRQAEDPPPETEPETSAPAAEEPSQTPSGETLTFTAADLESVSVRYLCDYRPELEALLTQSLDWDLTDGEPAVLIVHSHASEAYSGTEYIASGDYRTLDTNYNVVSIGDEVARILEAGGVTVIHDRAIHDYPDYNSGYTNSRASIQAYLQQYPSIRMVLDLHRDAAATAEGQLVTSATAGGQRSAQIMLVMGSDAGGSYFPGWQENLSLGLKLSVLLEQTNPGINRPINLRSQRFNLDLSPGSLLVEVGAAGNTHEEAILAANALAQAILELAHGSDAG